MKRSPGFFVVCVVVLLATEASLRAETAETAGIPTDTSIEGSRATIPYQNELERTATLPDLSRDPHVIEMLRDLWRLTHNGSLCHERGAWIVRDEAGSHACRQVPPTYQCNRLTFNPIPPPGAIAFVHTHPAPRGVSRKDEGADRKVAEAIGLPLYTIEIDGVSKYDPATNKTTMEIAGQSWKTKGDRDGCSCPVPRDADTRLAKRKRGQPRIQSPAVARN